MKPQLIRNAIPDIRDFINKARQVRINGYAIFDFAVSYLAAYLISFPLKPYITRKRLFYLVLPVAVLAHTIFGVHTPLTDQFWDTHNYFLIKFIVIFSLLKALNIDIFAKLSKSIK